ncbi:hypothetical protein B0H63DRAFT_30065 [Podospora didyma]|uniref:Uncharacterized protein n=1 Tax=Podospora didyma TaxID=330526 RepID=A0AAE0U7H7_9PEZI|nr:hypothetical protein B0H63DRAFT_30065 [Podospora didyma]
MGKSRERVSTSRGSGLAMHSVVALCGRFLLRSSVVVGLLAPGRGQDFPCEGDVRGDVGCVFPFAKFQFGC